MMKIIPRLGPTLLQNLQGKAVAVRFIDKDFSALQGTLFTAQDDYLLVKLDDGKDVFVPFTAVASVTAL